jgi:hypothetical protein
VGAADTGEPDRACNGKPSFMVRFVITDLGLIAGLIWVELATARTVKAGGRTRGRRPWAGETRRCPQGRGASIRKERTRRGHRRSDSVDPEPPVCPWANSLLMQHRGHARRMAATFTAYLGLRFPPVAFKKFGNLKFAR